MSLPGGTCINFDLTVQNNKSGASAEGMDAFAASAVRYCCECVWVATQLIISRKSGPKAEKFIVS